MNNSMVMMEEVRKPDVPSTLEAQIGSIAEGIQQLGRCKIDLGKTEREEEARGTAAARGAPPRGRRKLRIY